MHATDRLKSEHDLIERGLNLLERSVQLLEQGPALPDGFPRWIAGFFQQFADQCHHAKEEDVFFPLLKQRGIPEQGGPLGCMLHEHALGRDCVGRMLAASQQQPFDARAFSEAARQYAPLLRQHIFKENNVLFRLAEQVMSPADDADVSARYAEIERERGLEGWQGAFSREVARWETELRA